MDLTNILSDPELGGATFSLRRDTWRKHYGETILETSKIFEDLIGNIQPAASSDLHLTPHEEHAPETIQILSSFPFSLGTPDTGSGTFVSPDIILFSSKAYKVIRTKDWSAAGGFHKAWAILQLPEGETKNV